MARTDWNALEQSAIQKLEQGRRYTVAELDAVLTVEERTAVLRDSIGARKHFQHVTKIARSETGAVSVEGQYALKGGA